MDSSTIGHFGRNSDGLNHKILLSHCITAASELYPQYAQHFYSTINMCWLYAMISSQFSLIKTSDKCFLSSFHQTHLGLFGFDASISPMVKSKPLSFPREISMNKKHQGIPLVKHLNLHLPIFSSYTQVFFFPESIYFPRLFPSLCWLVV